MVRYFVLALLGVGLVICFVCISLVVCVNVVHVVEITLRLECSSGDCAPHCGHPRQSPHPHTVIGGQGVGAVMVQLLIST